MRPVGARPLNRVIQKKILNPLSQALIGGFRFCGVTAQPVSKLSSLVFAAGTVKAGETVPITVMKDEKGEDQLVVETLHAPDV